MNTKIKASNISKNRYNQDDACKEARHNCKQKTRQPKFLQANNILLPYYLRILNGFQHALSIIKRLPNRLPNIFYDRGSDDHGRKSPCNKDNQR